MEVGKIQPNDVEAEQAVLGSMLLDKDAVTNAIEILKQVMKDINNKEIRDDYFPRVIVYGSKENIDKLQENRENKYNQSLEIELQELREENYELKRENRKLRNQVYEVDD